MGSPVGTHKGVRVDDDVDSFPRVSGITLAELGTAESSGFDLLDSVGITHSELKQIRQEPWWSPIRLHDGRDPCHLTSYPIV